MLLTHGIKPPYSKMTKNGADDAPAVLRTCTVLPRRCTAQMIGVFTRPVKATGHRPVVVRTAAPLPWRPLHLEILALRHQLAVVNRTHRSRLRLTPTDRVLTEPERMPTDTGCRERSAHFGELQVLLDRIANRSSRSVGKRELSFLRQR